MKNGKDTTPWVRFGAMQLAALMASLLLAGGAPDAAFGQQAKEEANAPTNAPANDYPTLARVEYVFACLNENPGPRHEMLYKCVCATDRVAESVPYDRWVELSTIFQAQPIAGERGAYIRERKDIQEQLKSYRDLQLKAKKACFIPTDPK